MQLKKQETKKNKKCTKLAATSSAALLNAHIPRTTSLTNWNNTTDKTAVHLELLDACTPTLCWSTMSILCQTHTIPLNDTSLPRSVGLITCPTNGPHLALLHCTKTYSLLGHIAAVDGFSLLSETQYVGLPAITITVTLQKWLHRSWCCLGHGIWWTRGSMC